MEMGKEIVITSVNANHSLKKALANAYACGFGFDIGKFFNSPETMPVETKSFVYSAIGYIRAAIYENGRRIDDKYIMPDIIDVSVMGDKVVSVTFADGTREKAVLAADDKFSFEQGVSICITKKMLSMQTNGNGSSAYNKLINHCLKLYENNRKAEEKAKADEQAAKEKEY